MNPVALPAPSPAVIDVWALPCALGAPSPGSARAPAVLRQAGAEGWLGQGGALVRWYRLGPEQLPAEPPPDHAPPAALGPLLRQLAQAVAGSRAAGHRPLVLGGDHSLAAGTWRGLGRATGQAPGLVWIDAHLDAHSPDTSASGRAHGMPLAALLGWGHPLMTGVPGPALDPARVVVLGARSHESPELERLTAAGVRVVLQREVDDLGLPRAWAEAVARARGPTGQGDWGVSLDVDALDPAAAPGVSTPVAGGLDGEALLAVLQGLWRQPGLVGVELMEFNPDRDDGGRTLRWLRRLLQAL